MAGTEAKKLVSKAEALLGSEGADVYKAIGMLREASGIDSRYDRRLCDALLCSDSEEHYREAMEVCARNLDKPWAVRMSALMHYNGTGVPRDPRRAKRMLSEAGLVNNGKLRPAFRINPAVWESDANIVLCGSDEEVRALFCVCSQYSVRPDMHIADGDPEMPEFLGPRYADGQGNDIFVMYSSRKGDFGNGRRCLYYTQFPMAPAPEASSLLLPDPKAPDRLVAPANVSEYRCAKMLAHALKSSFDHRALNEKGYCVWFGYKGDAGLVPLSSIERRYRLGKALYDRVSAIPGRKYLCSFRCMGDNYRLLGRCEGVDYSDATFLVPDNSRDLPELFGYSGRLVSKQDIRNIRLYVSMTDACPEDLWIVPHRIMYPGLAYGEGSDTNLPLGPSRRLGMPALGGTGLDVNAPLRRERFPRRRRVLLNPTGNTMKKRSGEEARRDAMVMSKLPEALSEMGFAVYTNAPFEDQEVLPGTTRYSGTICELAYDLGSFDFVVTVFTGLMEVAMYTGCNIIALSYSPKDTRVPMAESFGSRNYWEINVMDHEPGGIVNEIVDIICGTAGRPEERGTVSELMTGAEKVALFEGSSIDSSLVDYLLKSLCAGDVEEMAREEEESSLLECVVGRAYETGTQVPADEAKARGWYQEAASNGARWAAKKLGGPRAGDKSEAGEDDPGDDQ